MHLIDSKGQKLHKEGSPKSLIFPQDQTVCWSLAMARKNICFYENCLSLDSKGQKLHKEGSSEKSYITKDQTLC